MQTGTSTESGKRYVSAIESTYRSIPFSRSCDCTGERTYSQIYLGDARPAQMSECALWSEDAEAQPTSKGKTRTRHATNNIFVLNYRTFSLFWHFYVFTLAHEEKIATRVLWLYKGLNSLIAMPVAYCGCKGAKWCSILLNYKRPYYAWGGLHTVHNMERSLWRHITDWT